MSAAATLASMVVGGLIAAGLAWLTWAQLGRLPEPPPELDPDPTTELASAQSWTKLPYRDLQARSGWRTLTVLTATALGAWAGVSPHPVAWLAWASLGLVLVVTDLATTYLPVRLHWPTAALTMVGLIAPVLGGTSLGGTSLGGTSLGTSGVPALLTMAAGAAAAGGFFWLIWRWSGAFGYGDVRLAVPLGALAASLGWSGWFTALLAGTAIGAVHGLIISRWRRTRPSALGSVFPYGPALWCGPWVALAISQW